MLQIDRLHSVALVVYHSINEYSEQRIRVPSIVTPTIFEAQIQYLTSIARVIPLQEYLDHVNEGKPLSQKSIIITFDDGYKDNLTIALPILKKYAVPATFFITTGYIGTNQIKWEDQLNCLIKRSKTKDVTLTLPSGDISLEIGSEKAKLKAINAFVKILGHLNQVERSQVLDELRKHIKVECDDQTDVMMMWDDVRQLANAPGISIGSHTVTHSHLTRIPNKDVIFEVTNSKKHLENEIGKPVTLFSYPYGDFNQDVLAAVRYAGYTGAGTIEYGQNSIHSDPFRLKRVLIPNQSGRKFSLGMRLRTSVVGEFLRNSYNAISGIRNPY